MEPVSLKRPVSIRNYVQNTTAQKRPARFVKPLNSASTIGKVALPSTEFIQVHQLLERYEKKIYIEGYLQKKNDLKSNGSSCNVKNWSVWYVELCGPVLSLWDASESSTNEDIFPQYINITDSTINLEQDSPPNTFSLNSAGANRYILQALNTQVLHRWITAIRLSCFECSRIQEIYTKAFISRSQYSKCIAVQKKARPGQAGFLHARFPNATGWKQYWVVVTNQKKQKSLFGKKIVPTSGRIMFYESKKAKHPVMTLQHVVQAYTVYPESPKLINTATLFKIEGSLYKNDSQLLNTTSSTLLMASNTNEMVDWLIHVFDAFHLYGLPGPLLSDPHNIKALDFGEPGNQRLFLELEEIGNNSLSNKADFIDMLAHKLKNNITLESKNHKPTNDDDNDDDDGDDDSILSTPKQKPYPIKISESNRLRSTKSSDSEASSSHTDESIQTKKNLMGFSRQSNASLTYSPKTPVTSPLWPTHHSTTSVVYPDHKSNKTNPFYCSTDTLQHPQMGFSGFRAPDIQEDEGETSIFETFPTRIQTNLEKVGSIKNSPLSTTQLDEKEKQVAADQDMMQQYMQQHNMVPVLMSATDPRLTSESVMMIDPRLMSATPLMTPDMTTSPTETLFTSKEPDLAQRRMSSTKSESWHTSLSRLF
ncbi:unnamed protein product [Rhizopus stolonifer]